MIPTLTVIIPARNEEESIRATVRLARCHSTSPEEPRVLVVDGDSTDGTAQAARSAGARVLVQPGHRGARLNAAARYANTEHLLFLHADTKLPEGYDSSALKALHMPGTVAAAFRLAVAAPGWRLRVVESVANLRATVFQLPYGDQGLFLTRKMFDSVGGFPDLPFMEDYVMVRKLARKGKLRIADTAVATSARRWATLGVFRTTIMNQCVIAGYHIGIPVSTLAKWYRGTLARACARRDST